MPRHRRIWWLALAPLGVARGAAEALCAAAIFRLVAVLQRPESLVETPLLGAMLTGLSGEASSPIHAYLLVVAGLFVLSTLLTLLGLLANHHVVEVDRSDVERRLFTGYLRAPYTYHLQHDCAQFVHEMTQRVSSLFEVLSQAVVVMNCLAVSIAILLVLLIANPAVTAITAAIVVALMASILWASRRASVALGEQADALGLSRLRSVWQGLGAIKEIRALGRERGFLDAFAVLQKGLLRNRYLGATLALAPRIATELCFVIAMLIVVSLLARSEDARLLPTLGLYAYAGLRFIPMISAMTESLNRIRWNDRPVERLVRDFEYLSEFDIETRSPAPMPFDHRLELRNVGFTYPGGVVPALTDISIDIRKGESIGIVGATGAGKSTLIHLIAALLEPSRGELNVDGIDVHGNPAGWRRRVGYVPQALHLIDDSLRRNVALGVADKDIDEPRMQAAARIAQLCEFVRALPEGLDTRVGERGVRLSGGQRQRVAIARALYDEPDLILFDEATAALDPHTERAMFGALREAACAKTLIIATHRLHTVAHCDRLVFLSNGAIAALGSYDELVENCAEFRAMIGVRNREGSS